MVTVKRSVNDAIKDLHSFICIKIFGFQKRISRSSGKTFYANVSIKGAVDVIT